MKIKHTFYCLMLIIFIIMSFFCGCGIMKKDKTSGKLLLKNITYDTGKKYGYTVYIKENADYVPYLVLTSNYNGNILLLRKEVLEKNHVFNDYIGYYRDSLIDQYLNGDYLSTLATDIQRIIPDTEISITAKSSMGIAGTDTESITRKVFLLSCTEVGLFDTSFTGTEGKALKYFKDVKSRIAYDDKNARCWWLRTGYTMNESTVWAVFTKGEMGCVGAYEESGIRPAFCLKNTALIEEKDDANPGKTVYVIVR